MAHPETEKIIRKVIAHAGTIKNAAQELLQAIEAGDDLKELNKTKTIEQRVVLLVQDLGMAHLFQQEIKQ